MAMRTCILFIIVSAWVLSSSVFAQDRNGLKDGYKNECDLQEAIDIALVKNPELAAMALELDAAEARIKQASLWSNPTFEAETENFSGDNPGFSRSENTFSITQPFLLGGKIKYQKNVAEKEKEILQLHYEAAKRDLILKVEEAVYEILLAQENLAYAIEAQKIAEHLYDFNTIKVARKDSSTQRLSAEIEFSQTELEVMNAEKSLEIARKNLTVLWGGAEVLLGECKGDLDRKFNVPEYNEIKKCLLKNNPEIRAIALQEEKGDFLLMSAKAERIPDVDLGFGVRRFEEDDTYSFVAGFSVPLPLFNRNQGSIQEALVNQRKVEVDGDAVRNRLLFELNEAYKTFETAEHQVDVFKKTILPKTESYFALTEESYNGGALEYLEVLEAQRTLVETKKRYIESLKTLQDSVAKLERLCSRHFHGTKGDMF
jgi:cobalt-zinc-cadmium efflux system outer membrane protein